jgi:hypothetical protein
MKDTNYQVNGKALTGEGSKEQKAYQINGKALTGEGS